MRVACWITKATNTHSNYTYVTHRFLQQQWLHERALVFHYTHNANRVNINVPQNVQPRCDKLRYYERFRRSSQNSQQMAALTWTHARLHFRSSYVMVACCCRDAESTAELRQHSVRKQVVPRWLGELASYNSCYPVVISASTCSQVKAKW